MNNKGIKTLLIATIIYAIISITLGGLEISGICDEFILKYGIMLRCITGFIACVLIMCAGYFVFKTIDE